MYVRLLQSYYVFRLLYWTDADPLTPKIEYSWMNGEHRKALVSTRLIRPSALTIDYVMNDTVYWADYKLGVIESINVDGTNRQQIMDRGMCMIWY